MKTTKIFFMAALALMTVACSNDDNDIQTPAEQPTEQLADNMVTITAKLAPKSGSAQTRVLSDQTTYIKAEWAQNEQLKIISANGYPATANIDAVDGSGVATISFTIDAAAKGKDCTIIYPASAAVTESAGVYTAQPMTAQTGTLSNDLDVRIGKGTITDEATPQLEVTTQPAAQFAIFKFDVKNANASASINVKPLTITIGAQDYVITPADATSTLYAALPAVNSQTVSFSATGSDSKTYTFSKDGVSFAAGKYYQSTLKMAKAPALAAAFVNGATIKVNFKWRGRNNGDYVQGVYNASSGAFTVTKGGDYWGADDSRAVYKVEKSGDNIIIGAGFKNYNGEAMVWSFDTTNDTYTYTQGSNVSSKPSNYGLISVTLNGTDITSQLTQQ